MNTIDLHLVHICDRICENVPNCGFNNYAIATILYPSIILSLFRFFSSYELLSLLSRLGKYGTPTPFVSLLTAVRKPHLGEDISLVTN